MRVGSRNRAFPELSNPKDNMTNETLMAIHREACKSMTDTELADTFPQFRIGSPARKAIMAELASRKDRS